MTVGTVAVDPNDPQVVWAGTGENVTGCEGYFGVGLLRSGDGGLTALLAVDQARCTTHVDHASEEKERRREDADRLTGADHVSLGKGLEIEGARELGDQTVVGYAGVGEIVARGRFVH